MSLIGKCMSILVFLSFLSDILESRQTLQIGSNPGSRVIRRRKVNHENENVTVLDNYDKMTIKILLLNKTMKVGEVVLVNGKPALIKRRRKSSINDLPSLSVKDKVKPSTKKKSIRIRSRNLGESYSNSGEESRQIMIRRSKVAQTSLTPKKKRVLRRKLVTRY